LRSAFNFSYVILMLTYIHSDARSEYIKASLGGLL